MSTRCTNCGSPISFSGDGPTKCPFCEVVNAAPPKIVEVAVPVVEEAPVLVVGEKRCPHCRKKLVTVSTEGVDLAGCGACGGIWIDNRGARRVLAKPERIFAELARRCAAGARGSRGKSDRPICVECPAVLDRVHVHGIELDTCSDHGTWFDAYELTGLVLNLRNEPTSVLYPPTIVPDPEPAGPVVHCETCRQPIPRGFGNIAGDGGLKCEACWRKDQADLLAADAERREKEGFTVAGALLGIGAVMLGAAATTRSKS